MQETRNCESGDSLRPLTEIVVNEKLPKLCRAELQLAQAVNNTLEKGLWRKSDGRLSQREGASPFQKDSLKIRQHNFLT